MQTVEFVYRYDGENPQVRSRPASTEAALLRLQEGNRAFAELLSNVKNGEGSVRHVIDVDARDFGLSPGADAAPLPIDNLADVPGRTCARKLPAANSPRELRRRAPRR